jgi:thioredoxin-dependent peroxiredoxin
MPLPNSTTAVAPDIADPAPDFTLPCGDGETVSLSALRGAPVVLFFYPRNDTPGCTRESIGFSDALPAFTRSGARVFGISADSTASHVKFAAKHGLAVPLLSDPETTTCQAYGTWVEKRMYGRTFMGIARTTFLIDAQGRIARIWRRVKVPGHVTEVLDAVQIKTCTP